MARAKKQGEYRFLNVSLPIDILERLDEYSATTRIPKVAIAELALREYLDRVVPIKSDEKGVK